MQQSLKPASRIVPYDVATQLRTPEEVAAYLEAWVTQAPDDASGMARAVQDAARALHILSKSQAN